jgi:hypothetical protein
MATIPHGAAHGGAPRSSARRLLDPTLILAAAAFMAYGAFWPIFDTRPGRGVQILTLVVIAVTLAAGFAVPRGSRPPSTCSGLLSAWPRRWARSASSRSASPT